MKRLLLTGAMLVALSFSAKAQEQILTSFESTEVEAYEAGTDLTQYTALWSTVNTKTQADVVEGAIVISDEWASEGTQSLHFPAQSVNSQNPNVSNYALTGGLNFTTLPDVYTVGFDVKTNAINAQAGSNFNAEFSAIDFDAQETYPVARVLFQFDGTILAANYETEEFEEVGEFLADTPVNVKWKVNGADEIILILDDVEVATFTVDPSVLTGSYYFAFGADDWGTDYYLDNLALAAQTSNVKNNDLAAAAVFPNPSNGVINIANVEGLKNASIADINGRTVKTVNFAGTNQVNISDLANGVYMMTINSDKGSVTKKIVKN